MAKKSYGAEPELAKMFEQIFDGKDTKEESNENTENWSDGSVEMCFPPCFFAFSTHVGNIAAI